MGVVQNSIDIQKIIEAGGDPTIAAKVAELEAEIGDENSGIIKDIDDLQEANALIMTSVSAIKTTADSAKARADQAVLWSERKGYVGKNIIPFPYYETSKSANDVTFTVNSDNSVTVNTTGASADTNFELFNGANLKVGGQYILSGCPSGGSISTYGIQLYSTNSSAGAIYDVGNGYAFTENQYVTRIVIRIKKDAVLDNVTFYPMVRLASIADNTYEPYLPSNNELLQTATLKSVTAATADFAAFKTAIAAL